MPTGRKKTGCLFVFGSAEQTGEEQDGSSLIRTPLVNIPVRTRNISLTCVGALGAVGGERCSNLLRVKKKVELTFPGDSSFIDDSI